MTRGIAGAMVILTTDGVMVIPIIAGAFIRIMPGVMVDIIHLTGAEIMPGTGLRRTEIITVTEEGQPEPKMLAGLHLLSEEAHHQQLHLQPTELL